MYWKNKIGHRIYSRTYLPFCQNETVESTMPIAHERWVLPSDIQPGRTNYVEFFQDA